MDTGALVLAAVLLVAVNVIGDDTLHAYRADFTAGHLYTLTPGTRQILADLREPITLRLFLSSRELARFPEIADYANRVRELLEQYRRRAHGKIRLRFIDPRPFTAAEDRAVGYGLQGMALDSTGTKFYFGLVGSNSTDGRQTIPFFSPSREPFLEYDISKLIYGLEHPKPKTVGLLSGLPLVAADGLPLEIRAQIGQLFTLDDLPASSKKIPASVDTLLLVRPQRLPAAAVHAATRFILAGGRALILADPYAQGDARGSSLPAPAAGAKPSPTQDLFSHLGVHVSLHRVVGDLNLAEQVRFSEGARSEVVAYPVWMGIPQTQMDRTDPVTADLGKLVMVSPGRIKALPGAHTRFTPLVWTTAAATTFKPAQLAVGDDPGALLRTYHRGRKPLVMAARVTGPVPSAAGGERPGSSPARINVIVIADTDFLRNRFWLQRQHLFGSTVTVPRAGNGAFVLNALGNLSGSDALISIRSRGNASHPLSRIAQIRTRAALRFQQEEQRLLQRLKHTESRLEQLQSGTDAHMTRILSDGQKAEIARFRAERLRTRAQLRSVRHRMRETIEHLEREVEFVDIALVPALVALAGLALALFGARRRRRVRPAQPA